MLGGEHDVTAARTAVPENRQPRRVSPLSQRESAALQAAQHLLQILQLPAQCGCFRSLLRAELCATTTSDA
ncbi:hypothetical protein D3C74_425310 [compost metagenome]